jgi:hypothetical protein
MVNVFTVNSIEPSLSHHSSENLSLATLFKLSSPLRAGERIYVK